MPRGRPSNSNPSPDPTTAKSPFTPNLSGLVLSSDTYQATNLSSIPLLIRPNQFQERLLLRREDEILAAGGKFGGKSVGAHLFLVKGNPDEPEVCPITGRPLLHNTSYIYHPDYTALIIRRNQGDLMEFLNKFSRMGKPMGIDYVAGHFRLPMGGRIYVGHLKDQSSWLKYLGMPQLHRVVIEEAGALADVNLYHEIRACCRTVVPELRPQILLTANPVGPGLGWLVERFMDVMDADGNEIPPGTTIRETTTNPFTGEKITTTRVWMFSTLEDNPYAMADKRYIAVLATMGERERRAYLLGDWKAFRGGYFPIFRPRGPMTGEPANANHVVPRKSIQILPWFRHAIGLDWGYGHDAAAVWGQQDPDTQRLYAHDELSVSQTSPLLFGYEVARRSESILFSSKEVSIDLFMPQDAFAQGDDRLSRAELIIQGIGQRIGPKAVYCPELAAKKIRQELAIDDQSGLHDLRPHRPDLGPSNLDQLLLQAQLRRTVGINVLIANRERVIGWQYCLEFLRWQSVISPKQLSDQDINLAMEIMQQQGYEAYCKYIARISERVPAPHLPLLQICGPSDPQSIDGCPKLIAAIPKANHKEKNPDDVDPKHFHGMDILDAWRYLIMGIATSQATVPKSLQAQRKVHQALSTIPNPSVSDKIWLQRTLAENQDPAHNRDPKLPDLIIPRLVKPSHHGRRLLLSQRSSN